MFGRRRKPMIGLIVLEWVVIPTSPLTTDERMRVEAIIEHYRAGEDDCAYATFAPVTDLPGGIVIFVLAKDGIMSAINVAREVAIRLSRDTRGVQLLRDPYNMPHKVWVPTQTSS